MKSQYVSTVAFVLTRLLGNMTPHGGKGDDGAKHRTGEWGLKVVISTQAKYNGLFAFNSFGLAELKPWAINNL